MAEKDKDSSERNVRKKESFIKFPKGNLFIIVTIIAIVIGVILGISLRFVPGWEYYEKRKIFYLQFPGDLLINMQKMLILPLIVSSLISALATLKGKASGKMGLRAGVYYLSTSICAAVIGVTLVLTVRPGSRGNTEISDSTETPGHDPLDTIFDLIRNCFPANLIEACFSKQMTMMGKFHYMLPTVGSSSNMTQRVSNVSLMTTKTTTVVTTEVSTSGLNNQLAAENVHISDHPYVSTTNGINVLGLAVFSIFFGVIVSGMGPQGRPLADFFEALHQATLKMTMIIVWYSPIGVIFLIAAKLIEMQNPETLVIKLGFYILTVLAGLAMHSLITLPIIFFAITRKNPYAFMYRMTKALLTAWVTSSSLATLPVTMECLEVNNQADSRVAKFIAPVGATVNTISAGVYELVATIFIAQLNNIPLDIGQVITISFTAMVATIGTGVPNDILISVGIALTAGGLPLGDIGIILAVDWFLDRFCTPVNVLASSYCVGIVEHLSGHDLPPADEENVSE